MIVSKIPGFVAGAAGALKVKPAPGKYVLLCTHKSHLEMGMAKEITVAN